MKRSKETIYNYEVVLDPNGEGYTVTIPKLPGLVTEGRNLKESREMAKDAIRCYLGALLKDKELTSLRSRLLRREKIKICV
ncbi:type II toxin-antitoxin system HicB family antitoxin [Patescibacteria group bacterium]|nr:type II toxin-antitoxin system HicB family antitoxin [Patescibacteria group bacterium]